MTPWIHELMFAPTAMWDRVPENVRPEDAERERSEPRPLTRGALDWWVKNHWRALAMAKARRSHQPR
jgi:hypothetical protein